MNKSTYYFIGNISDTTSGFQVQDVKLIDGIEYSVFLDGIVVKKTTDLAFDELRNEIRKVAETLISLVVFQTNKPLSLVWKTWVEVKRTEVPEDTVGWFGLSDNQIKSLRTQRSPINKPWKISSKVYNKLHEGNGGLILALKDYHAAVSDSGPDSYLFAYRSVEDICRSITSREPQNSWNEMHTALGTDKTYLDPLIYVSECVRHGDINNVLVTQADRDSLLRIAKTIISKELERSLKVKL